MCRVLQTSMSPKDVLAATSEDRVQAFRVPVPMQVNGTDCAGFVMASVEVRTRHRFASLHRHLTRICAFIMRSFSRNRSLNC